ncbi:hypothetical protein PKF05_05825 [Fusobacterium simiae]|uniref:hypothetical protein n=1 Tax=Fusobacterium simiae TaxID=855 RepID=UPI0020C41673|nr:hypothetical protein [Fusobacterium simiae]MDC7955342.1 hypothetical protein [Fusobacterium simiae]
MNINVWKKIWDGIYSFIAIFCLRYILDTLLFKFGFDETAPKIYDNLFNSIVLSIFFGFFFKSKETKKSDIYFLIITIICTDPKKLDKINLTY